MWWGTNSCAQLKAQTSPSSYVDLMSERGCPPPTSNTGRLWLSVSLARPPYRAVILQPAAAAQQLPSFPHAGLQAAQLFVGLEEDFQLVVAPAPPDTQAPLHVFLMKATHNCVLCHQCCLLQDPGRKKEGEKK